MSDFNWDKYESEDAPISKKASSGTFDWNKHEAESSIKLPEEETFGDTAKRYGKDALVGTAEFGHDLLNLPHNLVALISKNLASKVPSQKDYDFSSMVGIKNKKPSDELIQTLTQIAPSLLLPEARLGRAGEAIQSIPKIGGYLRSALGQSIPQAAYAGASELGQPNSQPGKAALTAGATNLPFSITSEMLKAGSPLLRNIGKLATAGGGGYLGHEVAKETGIPGSDIPTTLLGAYLAHKGINPKSAAQKAVFGDIKPDQVREKLDAAKRLGLDYLTPAEAATSPYAAAAQGKIGKTEEGSKLLYEKGKKRVQSEADSINNLLDTIYNKEELPPEKAKAYDAAMQSQVPNDFIAKHADKPVVKAAIQKLENDPAYKQSLQSIPRNSFEYWDKVKRVIGDMEESALSGKNPSKYKASILNETRKSMVNEMDTIMPEYKNARSMAERGFIRENLEKAFDKKDITGTQFYKAIENKKEFEKILGRLSAFPEAQQQLKDMKLVFRDLIPSAPSIRTASALEKTSMSNPRALVQSLEENINKIFGSAHDKSAVELMTSPNWDEKLKDFTAPGNKEKFLSALISSLGKTGGQYAAKQNY